MVLWWCKFAHDFSQPEITRSQYYLIGTAILCKIRIACSLFTRFVIFYRSQCLANLNNLYEVKDANKSRCDTSYHAVLCFGHLYAVPSNNNNSVSSSNGFEYLANTSCKHFILTQTFSLDVLTPTPPSSLSIGPIVSSSLYGTYF